MLIEGVKGELYSQCRIPGIVVTEKGTLLAYYECRRTNSDWADMDLKVIRSTDEGESWETVLLISGNGNTLNNPVMFVKGEEIHLLFFKNYKHMHHCVSTDDGLSFSTPEEKTVETDFFYNVMAAGPGHGIVHNGTMIVPVWFAQNHDNPYAHAPTITATLSSTDGEEWYVGEVIGKDFFPRLSSESCESCLAITADNRVLVSMRNTFYRRHRIFAISDTGIDNWKNVHVNPNMPDPHCMGSMCHYKGKVYHINCASETERADLTIKVSDDCFKTFESIFVDTPAGYSDLAIYNDTAYVMYERDSNNGGLYFTKIKI